MRNGRMEAAFSANIAHMWEAAEVPTLDLLGRILGGIRTNGGCTIDVMPCRSLSMTPALQGPLLQNVVMQHEETVLQHFKGLSLQLTV